ncbi:MAG: sodium:proton antiporter, partial [Thermoproteota archaeon]|nr:sodium:proton antiporter [Thermoproteota archaeon]
MNLDYVILAFLGTIFIASLVESRTKIPYTMMLVALGIVLSLVGLMINGIDQIKFESKLIIDFVIPPLIFEAMMRIDYKDFMRVKISVLLLATAGVVIATIVVGLLLMYVAHLPFQIAFVFAALISPTDPAIVIKTFKILKVPKLLSTILEMESSFNDATGIIIFTSVVGIVFGASAAITGDYTNTPANPQINIDILHEIGQFLLLSLGGMSIGLIIAVITNKLHTLMNNPFSEISLTITTIFGSAIVANALGLSGLIAVATAGLYFGNVTMKKESAMSSEVRETVSNFWDIAAFFANSVAFLYLGVTMNVIDVGQNIILIILVFSIVLIGRTLSTYPILTLVNKFTKEKIPLFWQNIIMIGGMRGALSVALVTSLPQSELKNRLEIITFGVVLFSLIIQYVILS